MQKSTWQWKVGLSAMRTRRPSRSGFTLIDVTITLLVMGIMAAITIPRYGQSMANFQVQAAALRVAADIEYARQEAKLRGTTRSVQFDASTETYQLPNITNPDRPGQAYSVNLTRTDYPATIETVSFGSGGTGNTINFDMYGRPDFGGNLVLKNRNYQRTIRVNGTTGRITIE